jgi:hypothetical protein
MSVEQVTSGQNPALLFFASAGGASATASASAVGSSTSSSAAATSPSSAASRLTEAVLQTLAAGDVGTTTAAAGAANVAQLPVSAQQALQTFVQDLAGAIHEASTSNSGATATPISDAHSHGRLETGLQKLVNELADGGSSEDATNSTNTTLSQLQQDFQNLLYSLGQSGSNPTLQGFLQALSQNLQGSSSVGSVVSTQA